MISAKFVLREIGCVKEILWEIGSMTRQMNESRKLVLRKTGIAKRVLHRFGPTKVGLRENRSARKLYLWVIKGNG